MDEEKEKMGMIQRIKGLLKRRGFELFTKPFELNIVGLRNNNPKKADEIHVFYKTGGKSWNYHIYEGVTDPVVLLKGKNDALLLKEGQYKDAYAIGMHREKIKTLVESKAVTILENYQRDAFLASGKSKKGMFGIDIIPLSALRKDDAGCQIFLSDESFAEFMQLCAKHQELNGNHFTYTLIDFRAGKRSLVKAGIAVAASILTTLLLKCIFGEEKKKRKK